MRLSSSGQRQQGSVVLVALCFLAVLGIALASYLAVGKQAMKLSNRSYQRSLSAQLAEGGIEQSLWSFGWNNWSTWDKTTIPGTAVRHINYSATKYNNGVLGSIMLRVDRYDATIWNNFTAYKLASHDMVWYQGVWYQCINDTIGTTTPSDGGNWVSAPAPWNALSNYQTNNIVLYQDAAYRCTNSNINTSPTNTGYWTLLGGTLAKWDSGTNYAVDNVVLQGGMSFRCAIANSNKSPPNSNYWVGAPVVYADGIATPPDNPAGAIATQVRAFVSPAPLFPSAIAATSAINLSSAGLPGIVDSYNSLLGDYPPPVADSPRLAYSATVASAGILGTAITMSGTNVQGYISASPSSSSPYAPTVNFAGSLKGIPTGTGIDRTRINRSPNIPQFDPSNWDASKYYKPYDVARAGDGKLYISSTLHLNKPPPASGYWSVGGPVTAGSGAISIGNPSSPIPLLYHIDGNLTLFSSTDVLTINGPVILDVQGNVTTGNGEIIITPTGSAEILFSGQLQIDSSGGGIDNQTKDPKKLLLAHVGLSPATGHYFRSSLRFYGSIYMPYCSLAIDLPSSGGIYGAISADQIKSTLSTSRVLLHYDTSLRTTTFRSIDAPFAVTEWRELTDPAEKIVFP